MLVAFVGSLKVRNNRIGQATGTKASGVAKSKLRTLCLRPPEEVLMSDSDTK